MKKPDNDMKKSDNEFALQLSPRTCEELAAIHKDSPDHFSIILYSLFTWVATGASNEPSIEDGKTLPMVARAYLSSLAQAHLQRLKAWRGHRKA